ncbi:milk fat globule EGF and factor V/VIII domain containing [Rhinolophus ferrumequinum]|uniref:Milk fat globule EGF and factor V/VIII domain containing n=1 Tax=Rhinolophus ferrumequinum TaxID=59479 RepID=A0A7J7RB02_RHIFE|nr:milk fat globule EGF and factor V/VIII domain containing [Rhinolophus ferrumequinum]
MPGPRLLAALCGVLLCASGLFAASGDFCDSSQCLNGGTCLLDQDNLLFYCLCPEGFTGLICNETEKGPCFPNPCLNDAECRVVDDSHRGDVFTEYICKCPDGYTGTHCETTCTMPLGMQTGAIADAQISASSLHFGFMGLQRWAPELARLHRTGIVNAWTASNYDRKPWIQVNLLRKMRVTGVVTQGASRSGSAEYVKSFKVAYSLNGKNFQFVQGEDDSGDKIFKGNWDNNSLKTNMFDLPLEVQYVRLVPLVCHRGCTLRFELLGCELSGCSEPLGLKDNIIPNKQITASSIYRTWGLSSFSWYPYYARLDQQGKFNAWTAESNSPSEWLQIDLGYQRRVTGIITQGARDFGHIQYVAAYKVAHSNDGTNWTEYKDQGAVDSKIFPGNLDNNSHKKNMFETPFLARFVRILPVAWHNRITLRVELLGC